MKKFKKIISLILTAIMLMGMLILAANAKSIEEYSTGDIIEFGSYPQSKVTDSATISALDAMSKNWISYGYYSGTGSYCDGQMKPSDYMKYCDISYNGNKYRAVTFSAYRKCDVGYKADKNPDYSVQVDNGYYIGNVYYFKFEPLKWRVLDPSEGFVMCTKAIDAQPYQNFIYQNNGIWYNNKSCTNYASDWATSSIRAWLNNNFYNTAFTSSEKNQIGTTYIKIENIGSSQYISSFSYDKIFLLSDDEVTNKKYGFKTSTLHEEDTARQIKSTDYANCQGCGISKYTDYYLGNSWWRLRPSELVSFNMEDLFDNFGVSDRVDYIYYDGSESFSDGIVAYTSTGIVPAFKFNPKSEIKEPVKAPDIKMSYKGTSKFTPSVPVGSDDIVEYKSSDTSVATVDKDGNITTVHKGTAEIICTVTDSAGDVKSEETCTVNVKFQWWQWLIWIFLLGFLWY